MICNRWHHIPELLLLSALLLSACAPVVPPPAPTAAPNAPLPTGLPDLTAGWAADDLRLLDPSDSPKPSDDLTAVYARRSIDQLQIRLDFLELQPTSAHDLYLALSSGIEGTSELPISARSDAVWDTLFVVPSQGEPYAQEAKGERLKNVSLSLHASADLDTVYLLAGGLDPAAVQSVQAFVTPPGSKQLADQSALARFDAPHPQPARLLMAFWNTLPAHTPAQALRSWDGAHTGPLGQRHGLYRLLDASSAVGVPVTLLDLKTPSSLSALDFLGQVDYVRNMQAQGLAILPDAAYGDPAFTLQALRLSREAALSFGLAGSSLAFGAVPTGSLPQEYRTAFAVQSGELHLASISGLRVIPLPTVYSTNENQLPAWWDRQAGPAGLSLDARRALLDVALAQDPSRLAVLGGSLPESAWGDSSVAPQAFTYLAGHPWIRPVSEQDLLTLSASEVADGYTQIEGCVDLLCTPPVLPVVPYGSDGQPVPSGVTQIELRAQLRDPLEALPPGPLTRDAWESYLQLTGPTTDPYRQSLQANYLGQVGHLVRLAQWASGPISISDCSIDLDFDGQPECLLSNSQFAATFEPDGARLLFAAVRTNHGAELIAGPYSQFGVGWGDPRDWQITAGPASDPNEIPGAFVDDGEPFRSFQAEAQAGQIRFTSAGGSLEKIFTLTPQGLRVRYRGSLPASVQIPLVFDPAARFLPGWAKRVILSPGGSPSQLTWHASGASLVLQAEGASLSITTFLDSFDSVHSPEDPDHAYPPGHFLPFPFALVEAQLEGQAGFSVEFQLPQ